MKIRLLFIVLIALALIAPLTARAVEDAYDKYVDRDLDALISDPATWNEIRDYTPKKSFSREQKLDRQAWKLKVIVRHLQIVIDQLKRENAEWEAEIKKLEEEKKRIDDEIQKRIERIRLLKINEADLLRLKEQATQELKKISSI